MRRLVSAVVMVVFAVVCGPTFAAADTKKQDKAKTQQKAHKPGGKKNAAAKK